MPDSLYVLVSTTDRKILEKCRGLEPNGVSLCFSDPDKGTYMYASPRRDFPHYLSVINDQGDFSVEGEVRSVAEGRPAPPESDSLVSFAHAADGRFVAKTDLWGILHHYFYHDHCTFICSNNSFVVASLVGAGFSETSLFEYLFFFSPLKDATWFENIRVLEPDQALIFDIASRRLAQTPARDLYEDIAGAAGGDLITQMTEYFNRVARALRGKRVLLSLSGGTDSRTVLSGLLKAGLSPEAVSFGRDDFIETRAIRSLTRKRGVKSTIYSFESLMSDWENVFRRASLVTNGLINPFRAQYANFYRGLPGDALFEGVLGSQFFKGEVPVGSLISPCYKAVIRDGATVREAIDSRFAHLSPEFRSGMESHIASTFGHVFKPVDSAEGTREFARFLFHFAASRIFGACSVLASAYLSVYQPFLSRRILRAVSTSYGLVRYNSLRRDFPGYIKCLEPEAIIVRDFDRQLYKAPLDRQFSFREAHELPTRVVAGLMRLRLLQKRVTAGRMHHGQVDSALLAGAAREFLRTNDAPEITELLGDFPAAEHLAKERCNLTCLRQLTAMDVGTMVRWITGTGLASRR